VARYRAAKLREALNENASQGWQLKAITAVEVKEGSGQGAHFAGVGRTGLAMARNGDLPRGLAAVHPRFRVPHRAEVALAVLVGALVATTDLRTVLGFSSTGVLVYYAIANACAFTQPAGQRRWPRILQVAGLVGCLVLVAALPVRSLVAGLVVLAAGLAGRLAVRQVSGSGRAA
jgi:basic amino acid/polyamine antiporter, APA family